MNPELYHPLFLALITLLCLTISFKLISSPGFYFQTQKTSSWFVALLCLVFALWLGERPIDNVFVDTNSYAIIYENFNNNNLRIDFSTEWFWEVFIWICKFMGLSVHGFFVVIEFIYFFTAFWTISIFVPTNKFIGILFVFSSLMFFSFATNGIRNGMACHIMLLVFALSLSKKYIPALILSVIAIGFHKSTLLPLIAFLAAFFLIRNFKTAFFIWVGCIIVSLIFGRSVASIISTVGYDARLIEYLNSSNSKEFSSTGFRWDFLIYSFPPIFLGWYVLIKRKIHDDWFRILCVTYILNNSVWILLIYMSFTNRFAYLSWFIYPVIFAYALINLPIWLDQDKKTGIILMAYCSFTVFMNTLYW